MANRSDLFSVNNGVLRDFVPIRIHDRGRFDKDLNKWVPVDKIIVMMMSDIVYWEVFKDGVKTGEQRQRFIKPMSFIPCAGYPDDPRTSRNGDRAFSGTFVDADADGEVMKVLVRREKGDNSTDVHLLVREGWLPHRFPGKELGRYLPSVVDEIKRGKKIGTPGSFMLGGSTAFKASDVEAADEAVAGVSKSESVIDGPVVHFSLYRLADKDSVIGQTRNGIMWQVTNFGGDCRMSSDEEAEAMRPIYDHKESDRREKAKVARIARLKKERDEQRAARLRHQEEAIAAPALQIIDDAVATPPVEEVAAA